MADASPAPATGDTPPTEQQPTQPEPDTTSDQLQDSGKKALEQERKARRDAEKQLRDVQTRLKEFEDRDKSEGEKLSERLAAAELRANEAEARELRARVALAKGLPADLAERLRGTTEEELTADADELLTLLKPAEDEPVIPRVPDLGQGARGSQTALNGDPLLRSVKDKLGIR